MEYVKVNFPEDRSVYIDGAENGPTNTPLRCDEGTHDFDLGEPKDYSPLSQRVRIADTSVLKPKEIDFEPAEPPEVA